MHGVIDARNPRAAYVLATVLLLLGGSAPAAAQAPAPASLQGRVLVMPFETDARLARTYWLGEGAAILVTDALNALGVEALTRDQRARVLDEAHLPANTTLTRATSIRVAQLVGASHAVFGTVTLDGPAVSITARALVVSEGRFLPPISEQGPLTDLFVVGRHVGERLAGLISGTTTSPSAASGDGARASLDAFEAYVKALVADDPELQRRLLRQSLEKQPGYDRALMALWALEQQLGDHEAALRAARAVGATSPFARNARFAASLSLIELKQYDEAYSVLWALADERFDAPILNNLGVIQLRRGAAPNTGVPTYYFTKASEQDPDDADLFFNLGYAYALERKPDGAVYWLREAVRRDPADGDAHFVLAESLQAYGAAAEASRERELARRLSARYEDADRRSTGQVPRGLERLKDTLEPIHTVRFDRQSAENAQKEQADLAAYHVGRARRLADEQKDGEAIGELRRALFLQPYNTEALLLTARLYLRMGQPREAADSARIALWAEDSAQGHVLLGEALLEARDAAGARAEAERALGLDPGSSEARALLARASAAPAR